MYITEELSGHRLRQLLLSTNGHESGESKSPLQSHQAISVLDTLHLQTHTLAEFGCRIRRRKEPPWDSYRRPCSQLRRCCPFKESCQKTPGNGTRHCHHHPLYGIGPHLAAAHQEFLISRQCHPGIVGRTITKTSTSASCSYIGPYAESLLPLGHTPPHLHIDLRRRRIAVTMFHRIPAPSTARRERLARPMPSDHKSSNCGHC